MDTFADRLVWALAQRDLTQEEFADILGLAQQTVSGWVLGKHEPKRAMAVMTALMLGISPAWLIAGRGKAAFADAVPGVELLVLREPPTLHDKAEPLRGQPKGPK
jgi:transcriptional regulator with XRE-family HTH domain